MLQWVIFSAVVIVALAIDLGVFHREAHEVRFKEALAWVCVWVSLAVLFNLLVYYWYGKDRALEFTAGYLIEYALSVDNIFVFIIIFSYFCVPPQFQHRVIFWGILGAVVMRGLFIVVGSALLAKFHWLVYLLGGFLVYTGFKTMLDKGGEAHPEKNPILRLFCRWIPMTREFHGASFLIRSDGKMKATPLLLVLVVVEATDVVFAVDSVPAIFAVSRDTFIVFTSNIFAILGLRSLYFLLSGAMGKLHYLKVGLGLILAFVGVKMILGEHYRVPIGASLGVIAGILGSAVAASVIRNKRIPRR